MHRQNSNFQIRYVLEKLIIPFILISLDPTDRFAHENVKGKGTEPINNQENDNEDNWLDLNLCQLLTYLNFLDLLVQVSILDLFFKVFITSQWGVILKRMNLFHTCFFLTHLLIFLIQVNEQFHRILWIPPGFLDIRLWKLRKNLHQSNERVTDLHQPRQYHKKP